MTAAGKEDVGRLNVPVNDSLGVSGVESLGDFDGQIQQALEFHRVPGDGVLQSCTFQAFHGDEGFAIRLADFVDGADVGMVQRGGCLCLSLESCQGLRVSG